MRATAKVFNRNKAGHDVKRVVIDGGGLVTLDGMGKRRILYQDTCDQRQVWTTSHCDNQAFPHLVVQNLTFAHGNSTGNHFEGGGGGAIFDRGGSSRSSTRRSSATAATASAPTSAAPRSARSRSSAADRSTSWAAPSAAVAAATGPG